MPGAITPAQAANSQTAGIQSTGLLNANQSQFAYRLATDTGLDPYVVAAWVHAEEPASSSHAPNGANNWLNIGATGAGNYAGANPAWANPITAADETAKWLQGASLPGYGSPSTGIQAILSTAGKDASAQISAIQTSGWAASGYPDLSSIYQQVSGSNSPASQIANAPITAATDVASTASSIASIASLLTSGSFWLRIGEAIAGIALLFMGLRSLTGNTTTPITVAKDAASTATKAAGAAAVAA